MNSVIVGISGGSGAPIARRVVDLLLEQDVPVIATCSTAGRQVWQQEMGESFTRQLHQWSEHPHFTYYAVNQIGAPIASGSQPSAGMIVAPCSMATVAAIAHGMADNLLRRAADVTIKERRPLVLMPRETPLSGIHLENLQRLAKMGAIVLVPAPAFYLHPKSVDDVVDYLAHKAIAALDPQRSVLPEGLRYHGMKEG
jgi:4-hydroxy-3-polyprenylbenzoate decarboxylase